MNNDELFLRQQRLLMRSSELRLNFINTAQVIKKPLAAADHVQAGLKWLYHNPQWPISALLLLAILRPQRALSWGTRAWWTWKTFKRAKRWIGAQPQQGIFSRSI